VTVWRPLPPVDESHRVMLSAFGGAAVYQDSDSAAVYQNPDGKAQVMTCSPVLSASLKARQL
jgi:hypothetical protein